MSKTISFSILGSHELSQKMLAVTNDVRYKGGRAALRRASEHLAGIVRENSRLVDDPATPRSIPANVVVRYNRRQYEATGNLGFRVGILGGAGGNLPGDAFQGNPGLDTRYWRHKEFGNSRTQAVPFMRRAMYENINALIGVFADSYHKSLTAALRRASR